MMFVDKLDYEINMFLSLSVRNPSIVVINPDDFIRLQGEISDDYVLSRLVGNRFYRNIKVIRSIDVEIGNFIIK